MAAWLVDLVTPYEQAESISGDLLEEFSVLASNSGVASARRWYWRQSLKTITHLVVTGFRIAPWSMAGAVFGGLLLIWIIPRWTTPKAIGALVQYYNFHSPRLSLRSAVLILHAAQLMLISCIVAIAAKGREIAAYSNARSSFSVE
jgi:hypothetical protein